jgi:hypothetical protein
MERKFSFDDMKFIAKSERVEDMLQVSIYDAFEECLLTAEYPAGATAAAPAKPAGKKRKGARAASDEEAAIADLIEQFQRKVEEGEIDLA